MGVNADGRRELLGIKVGDSESEGFWSEFIASLIAGGCDDFGSPRTPGLTLRRPTRLSVCCLPEDLSTWVDGADQQRSQ